MSPDGAIFLEGAHARIAVNGATRIRVYIESIKEINNAALSMEVEKKGPAFEAPESSHPDSGQNRMTRTSGY